MSKNSGGERERERGESRLVGGVSGLSGLSALSGGEEDGAE